MTDTPLILKDYLNYLKTIRGLSPSTIKEYKYDLTVFINFEVLRIYPEINSISNPELKNKEINKKVTKKFLNSLELNDLYQYLSYLDNEKNDLSSTRSRKIAALRSFFNYLYSDIEIIDKNITTKLKNPKANKRQPIYLTLQETKRLLNVISKEKNEFLKNRDLCIVFTFLTTGMRLSELVSIDINKTNEDRLTVIGKGNKERMIYLSDTCKDILDNYKIIRNKYLDGKYEPALFISTRKNRISKRAIQHMIDKYLEKAGFDTSIYSVHKLRHTAATLMYRYGNVDIRALQEILGHESVATTQIYTHIEDEDIKKAIEKNPLNNL
ncbi:MAG: tyrosine recombinase XerC [Tissierellia bacterium]|nr:tyrosine recombinase XerC [Tissierellia bacterium]